MNTNHNRTWQLLRFVYGVVPIVAGLDKFFNLLTQWDQYLSPLVSQFLPIAPSTLMGVFGVVEILVGAAILSRWTKLGAYVAAIWLVAIAANLLTTGAHLDVAVRDLVMAAGAYALGTLTAERSEGQERQRQDTRQPAHTERVRSQAA